MRTAHALLVSSLLTPCAFASESPAELADSIISAPGEQADGPVKGYRASRSATATKTDTPLREVPQAISVVPAKVLQDLGSANVERALDYAGGVSKQNNFGGLTLYEYSVRGLTTSEFYRDGFSANRGYPNSPDAATLERVEVLKGPASSLYGRGDPGGLVNLVSKKPQDDEFARFSASAGSWDRYRSTLDLNGALDEQRDLLGRLNLVTENNGSFRDHASNEKYLVAPSLSWQLNADTRLLIESEFVRNNSVFDRGISLPQDGRRAPSRSTFLGEPNEGHIDNNNDLLQVRLEHYLNNDWQLRLASHYKRGLLNGAATEPRRLSSADSSLLQRRYRQRDMDWHDSISQAELLGQVQTGSIEHQLLLGLEYENYRLSQRVTSSNSPDSYAVNPYNPVYGQPKPDDRNTGTDYTERTRNYALNLQDQLLLSEKLRGVLGLRLDRYEQQTDNQRPGGSESRQSHNEVTGRAGLLYQLTPAVGLFGNVSSTFKPNSGLSRSDQPFDPEQGIGYEAGTKLELFDGRLDATLAAFHIEKKNVLGVDPLDPSFNRTSQQVRSQGIDLQLSGQLSDAVRVIGSYAYIDAKTTKDDPGTPKGSRLSGVARHSGSLLGVYEFQQGWLHGSDLGAAVNYVGDRSGSPTDSGFELPAYTTVDLLAHYKASEQLTFGVNLNNVFDKKYYERAYDWYWVMPGEPRNLMFSVNLSL
ncbi:TonB-dependent siderophore receptor [Pseudomonas sp. SH1-B]